MSRIFFVLSLWIGLGLLGCAHNNEITPAGDDPEAAAAAPKSEDEDVTPIPPAVSTGAYDKAPEVKPKDEKASTAPKKPVTKKKTLKK